LVDESTLLDNRNLRDIRVKNPLCDIYAGKFKYMFKINQSERRFRELQSWQNMNCEFIERIRVFTWRQVGHFGVPEHKKNGHVGDHVKFVHLDLESNFFHV